MTSNTIILPEEDSNSLRCSICNGYLSVPPIKNSVDGTKFQCGRCDFTNLNINVRNYSYERVAKFMKFPCIYEKCKEKILWENVKYHEITCSYRKIRCPAVNCEIVMESSNIVPHFEEFHTDAKVTNLVAIMCKLTSPHRFFLGLLIHNCIPYIYFICNGGGKLKVSVYSVYNVSSEKFELSLSTSLEKKISLPGENIVPYDDRKHCIKCYLGQCSSRLHKYSTNYGNKYEMTTALEVDAIQLIFKTDTVYCKIFIEMKENKYVSDNTHILRQTVECPICKNYMLPPIYNCQTGHTICNACKTKLNACPTCQGEFINSRNFSVEELCENVNIPCQNNARGCKFIDNLKALQLHEEDCSTIRKGETIRRIAKVKRKTILNQVG